MIRAAILGDGQHVADELTRILIYHPDVHLAWIEYGPYAGNRVADTYAGLVGDTDLRFVAEGDVGEADVVFVCRNVGADVRLSEPRLRIVDLTGEHRADHGTEADGKYVYGLGELNRKAMVRGARRAAVPSPSAHAAVLALLPLAKAGKLYGDVSVSGLSTAETQEVSQTLHAVDPSCDFRLTAATTDDVNIAHERSIEVTVTVPSTDSAEHVRALFADTYDDHGFTFVVARAPRMRDVANTNKCVITIAPGDAPGTLRITSILDPHVKGSAGTAVHCMNLLFGLYERTGLTLKPSAL